MKNDNEKNKIINDLKKDLNIDVERLDIENVELNLKVEDIKTTPSSESDNLNRVNNVSEKENVDDTSFDNEINDDNFDSNEESEKIDDDFDSEEEQEELDDEFDSDEELEQLDDDFDSIEEPEQYDDEFNDKEDNNTNQEENKQKNDEQNDQNSEEKNDEQKDSNPEEKNEKPNEESAEQKNNENNSNSENKDNEEHKNENQDNKNEKPSEQEKKSNDSKDRPDANENVKKDSPNKPEQKQPESPSKDMSNNIKDKANSAKDRMSKQTNPAQNLKKNSGNGKSPLKDKLAKNHNNSSAASNGAKKAGDAAANGAKKAGQAAANGAKKAGQAAAKGAQAAGKLAAKAGQGLINLIINTMPYSAIVLGIILIIILAVTLIMYFVPGTTGNGDSGDYSKYSEKDQETMKQLEDLFSKYQNADGALAMSVVLYPYFTVLHSGAVDNYLISDNELAETEEETTDGTTDGTTETTEQTEEDIGENEIDDDVYLYPFRVIKMRNKLEDVLKELNKQDEEAFKTYLKDTYFESDKGYVIGYDKKITDGYKGYKTMINNITTGEEAAFKDALIKDIYDNQSLFLSYVYRHYTCTTNLQSAGTVEIEDMLKSNILVDVKVASCKSGSGVWDCESIYDNPIPLKQYVFGGTYEEFNSMDVEKTAAQMLAIKSYVVQRGKNMGWETKQDDAGNYVVTIRNNTNDLVYCDTDLGCKSGKTEVGDGNAKREPISEAQRQVFEDAWNKVFDKYIFDKDSNKTVGAFCQSRSGSCDFCKKGTCMSHDELDAYVDTSYDSIIGIQYSSYAMIQVEGDFANVTVAGTADCSGKGGFAIDDSNFVYYAQTDYPNSSFCQRTLSTPSPDGNCANGSSICSSGCGLVSMTMVTATLTQNYSINPEYLNSFMKFGTHCGNDGTWSGGMFPFVSNKFGLSYERKYFSNDVIGDMKKALDEGGLIIAAVCGGFKANKTYTDGCGGHFLVVRGYENDSVYISDPYQNYSLKTYADCVYKVDGKCVTHKMNFNTFYNDLKSKASSDGGSGAFWIFKGNTAFQELK